MRAHYLQHVPFEGPGCILPWLKSAGYDVTHTGFFESSDLPEPKEIDCLVIMGGPMSVNDEDGFPWLVSEKKFIREVIQSGKPVLGICLGAQLIANAMGAKVYANPVKEIGWFPVFAIESTDKTLFRFPDSITVFHWHGETFDLPRNAVRIARSGACENQAFQMGRSVMGLQFHVETTPELARDLVIHCRNELVPAPFIQSEKDILSVESEDYHAINGLMSDILAFLHSGRDRSQHKPAA